MRFDIRAGRRWNGRRQHRVYLIGDNGEVMAVGEPLNNHTDALATVATIQSEASTAEIRA